MTTYPCGHSYNLEEIKGILSVKPPDHCPLCTKYGTIEVPTKQRASTEEIIKAYDATKSIWLAGEIVGMCGQSVHERLVKANHPMKRSSVSEAEKAIIKHRYENAKERGDIKAGELGKELGMSKITVERCARRFDLTRMSRPMNASANAVLQASLKRHLAKHGHPKGMLGKTHSPQARKRMGEISGTKQLFTPDSAKQAKTRKMMRTRAENNTYANPRPQSSWKAGWRVIGGIRKYYRSRWESNYARYLQWLKENGQIKDWQHEAEVFWFDGIKRGCVSYLPDFKVTEPDGTVGYHEVKGWLDARSKTKLKRMAKYYPDVKLIVVFGKQYKSIAKSMAGIIEDWE